METLVNRPAATKQVTVKNVSEVGQPSPYDLLFSSESEDEQDVKQIRVTDHCSQSKLTDGFIDTGADITIMGRELFTRVAAVAKLRKKNNFRKPDKVPRTYDRKTFHLDGCIDMDISFDGKTMSTAVYVKMDAYDQLLLSEGVCLQLGIVSYHYSVDSGKFTKKSTEGKSSEEVAVVPTIRVNLVKSLRLPANQGAVVSVEQSTFMYHDCISLDGVDLKFSDTVMHLGHLLSYNLDDTPGIIRVTKDLNRKANFVLCTFKSADPFVKCFLIKAYCLSLYDCTLWCLSCKSFKSHTAIVHCVARIFPIWNLIFHRFNKLYSHAISHSSAIVKSTCLRSSSLIYTFFGHNYMSGHKYLKFYNSYDIYCASIIRNYRYYYGLFSPYEDVIRIM